MNKPIRIGTRDSQLALWQADKVKAQLEDLGHNCTLVPIKSAGDLILNKPLYAMGITGIFTRTLDMALLDGAIDMAVHSMKDVPTLLPQGIVQTAVLKRASYTDVLVHKKDFNPELPTTIATGSLRRRAQWLNRYPHHQVVGLRGNVNTRLKKLNDNEWKGAIFAKAGLERLDLLPENHLELDWMIPAPAQGAMVVVALETDLQTIAATSALNHKESDICTHVERDFLKTLEGGCTAPIGAHAKIEGGKMLFHGILNSADGKEMVDITEEASPSEYKDLGKRCADRVLKDGGKEIMQQLRDQKQN